MTEAREPTSRLRKAGFAVLGAFIALVSLNLIRAIVENEGGRSIFGITCTLIGFCCSTWIFWQAGRPKAHAPGGSQKTDGPEFQSD